MIFYQFFCVLSLQYFITYLGAAFIINFLDFQSEIWITGIFTGSQKEDMNFIYLLTYYYYYYYYTFAKSFKEKAYKVSPKNCLAFLFPF